MKIISAHQVYDRLGLRNAYTLVDVRPNGDVQREPRLLPGALRATSGAVGDWARAIPRDHPVVLYSTNGAPPNPSIVAAITRLDVPVAVLEGGMSAWIQGEHPTVRLRSEFFELGASRWVTRERPKIDRLACPWLVRRFIDPHAQFFYVPAHQVRAEAASLGAQPYDITNVTFSHRGPYCSFDSFLDEFDLSDPVLDDIAHIVRAADTGIPDTSPQAHGLLAISLGLSANIPDDILLLEQAMVVYDALYAWRKCARNETHSWPAVAS